MSTDSHQPPVETGDAPVATAAARDLVPFRSALRVWFLISLQTFGGPAGQLAVMQRVLVEDRRWIGQRRFNHALNYCMLLPGPEAQQLSIYLGWLLNGTRGGIAAGTLFVLPGVVALGALSAVYVAFGDTTAVAAVFAGLAPAVLAIVAQAVLRVARRSLTRPALIALAGGSFAALALFAVPFPVVIAVAALAGWLLSRRDPDFAHPPQGDGDQDETAPVISDDALHDDRPSSGRLVRILAIGLGLWAAPIAAVTVIFGSDSIFTTQGLFFSFSALVTFGGAYAVLAFIAQQAVETFGWLAPGEMVRGLALAETTPGPLIMVVQFVAFLAAYRNPGGLDPWVAATLGALLVTWVTFVPSFLFILLGAPYVERLRHNVAISAALAGITAAVVGVIANLALYFALNTLFTATSIWTWGPLRITIPDAASVNPVAVGITLVALVLTFVLRWPILRVLGVCALLGPASLLIPL
ncbi:chromate efflux transporter [Dietzia cercidiphylli]|uniref:chromate efflux transporter n=1 Tax=Dietzia cercidiphylli TaxID=498199 RepID=UPI003F812E03